MNYFNLSLFFFPQKACDNYKARQKFSRYNPTNKYNFLFFQKVRHVETVTEMHILKELHHNYPKLKEKRRKKDFSRIMHNLRIRLRQYLRTNKREN